MADAATRSPIARARSLLFVPGTRMDRFDKAHATGAGCVIVDLEDAVPPDQKADAREQIGARLPLCSAEVLARTLVRINAADTPHLGADLEVAAGWVAQGLGGVVLPKADAEALRRAAAALGARAALVPLVESLAGLDAVDALANAPQVVRLAFGHLDFQLDLGMRCSAEEGELAPVRFALVSASRRAHLPAPIDGVTVDTGNEARLQADVQRARAFGFGGKLCIHPAQVPSVNAAFAPTAAELAWARRVVEGAEQHMGRAFSLDGRMVDLPVILAARQTLEQASG